MKEEPLYISKDFAEVYTIISAHRNRVVRMVNSESLQMMWEVGGYVSSKLKSSQWGDGVVRQLAEYIHTQDPISRGWSYRTLYKWYSYTILTQHNLLLHCSPRHP